MSNFKKLIGIWAIFLLLAACGGGGGSSTGDGGGGGGGGVAAGLWSGHVVMFHVNANSQIDALEFSYHSVAGQCGSLWGHFVLVDDKSYPISNGTFSITLRNGFSDTGILVTGTFTDSNHVSITLHETLSLPSATCHDEITIQEQGVWTGGGAFTVDPRDGTWAGDYFVFDVRMNSKIQDLKWVFPSTHVVGDGCSVNVAPYGHNDGPLDITDSEFTSVVGESTTHGTFTDNDNCTLTYTRPLAGACPAVFTAQDHAIKD